MSANEEAVDSMAPPGPNIPSLYSMSRVQGLRSIQATYARRAILHAIIRRQRRRTETTAGPMRGRHRWHGVSRKCGKLQSRGLLLRDTDNRTVMYRYGSITVPPRARHVSCMAGQRVTDTTQRRGDYSSSRQRDNNREVLVVTSCLDLRVPTGTAQDLRN